MDELQANHMLRDHKKGGEILFQEEIIKGALRLEASLYIGKTKDIIEV